MSMGRDIFLTHVRNALHDELTQGTNDAAFLAQRVLNLGDVLPIVDTFNGDVIGFRFEMVARKHAEARKLTVERLFVITDGYAKGDA